MGKHSPLPSASNPGNGDDLQPVEPVFGIIKEVIGFRRFLLRGKEKAGLEWSLVSTSCNLKRLFNLGMSLRAA